MAQVARSDDELREYLEQLSGRSIRTRADLDAYLNELKARAAPEAPPGGRFWALAKQASLGIGLLIAVLQYYLIDVYLQIETLQRVQFLSPVAPVLRTSLLQLPGFLS